VSKSVFKLPRGPVMTLNKEGAFLTLSDLVTGAGDTPESVENIENPLSSTGKSDNFKSLGIVMFFVLLIAHQDIAQTAILLFLFR
jgi:hypothetical protein